MSNSRETFQQRIVVVTGGSSGLGFVIARAFFQAGARVALVARNAERLQAAAHRIAEGESVGTHGRLLICPADITSDDQFREAIDLVRKRWGAVEILVNAAGKSDRAAILDVDPERFQKSWELNFLAIVRCTRTLADDLIANAGHIINIGSLASKVVSPYLGTYPATKFALAAYSQQLRLELAPHRVHVLLVCPGPLRRTDAGQRYDNQATGLPAEVRQPGGGAQLRLLDPDRLAQQVLVACEQRRPELVVPGKVRWLAALAQLWPRLADWILIRKTVRPSS